ncbi:50S ribosomal protein L23 [Candidatus Peregrinibacteria bacterium]|nr:50S ribosomal protein L23 [Candidatus Peregrinibacteria bacterium]
MSSLDLFLRPVITEKATSGEKNGKYLFFVQNRATKIAIKMAFKQLYGVEATKVNVIRTAEKTRVGRTRHPTIKKKSLKKVIITTKAKKTVDLLKPKLK